MKQFFSIVSIMLLLNGCYGPKPVKQENLQNLRNVSYDISKNGDVYLKKEYEFTKKSKSEEKKQKQIVLENLNTDKKSYEQVPLFDKSSKKQISIKNKKQQDIVIKGDKVKVSVESIPINEFINLVFGSVLKVNYTLSEDVKNMKNPITLNMQSTQKASDFYKVVKKILMLNGIGIKNENNILFLYKADKKSSANLYNDIYIAYGRVLPSSLSDDKEVMLFVPYNYIAPSSTVNFLRQAGVKNIKFFYYIDGIQIMKGKAQEVRKALQIIKLVDRPFLEGKIPYLVNLDNMDVVKFVQQMKKIFALNGINVVNTPSKGGIVMTPIDELNAVYIITPKKEWLNMLLYWKKKLDVVSKQSSQPQLYVYHVKNRKADELAKAVNEVLGLSKTSTKTSLQKDSKVAGEKKVEKKKIVKKEMASSSFLISKMDYIPTVTADLDTNILMLKLTPQHYKILLPFIKELDKLPLQTLVEVTVAEVDMTDTFSLGFEYAIRNRSLDVLDTLTLTGGGSGLGIVFKGDYIDATINAFAEKQLLDIVSKPKILILNNSTGNINVGTQVPIITSETSAADTAGGTTPTINRNISYRTTGINLGLTPTINSNGVLTMNISISLSEAQLNDTSGIDSPLIVDRKLDTVAVIKSGDTILIGGLISKNKSKSKGGVPFLKDIPYFGTLFATQSHKVTKTELIMLIRPIIIQTPDKIREETLHFKTLLHYIRMSEL